MVRETLPSPKTQTDSVTKLKQYYSHTAESSAVRWSLASEFALTGRIASFSKLLEIQHLTAE